MHLLHGVYLMRLYLDTADPTAVHEAARTGLIDGVTTNPSILAESDRNSRETVDVLREETEGEIFVQTLGQTAEEMVEQGSEFASWDSNLVVKLPATRAGFAALHRLRSADVPAGITVVYTVAQGVLAAKADATFVAPYVGRITDSGEDGVAIAGAIQQAVDRHGFEAEVVAASVRTVDQATRLYERGLDAMTLAPAVFAAHFEEDRTVEDVREFEAIWGDRGDPTQLAGN